jgi:hypothetical protein
MAHSNNISNRKIACDYSSGYAAIYDTPYGILFVFVDEEENYSEENYSYIPSIPASQGNFLSNITGQA